MSKKIFIEVVMLFILVVATAFSQSKPTYYIKITFDDGPLKGTHVFTPEKGNYLSQINLELFEGVSKLNASKLTSNDGFQIHYISRPFQGEARIGDHPAKEYTEGCGKLNFIDLKNNQSYKRINGDFKGCTPTNINGVGSWKKTVYKSKRSISGRFSDTIELEIIMDDGSKKVVKTKVSVEFSARESRRI